MVSGYRGLHGINLQEKISFGKLCSFLLLLSPPFNLLSALPTESQKSQANLNVSAKGWYAPETIRCRNYISRPSRFTNSQCANLEDILSAWWILSGSGAGMADCFRPGKRSVDNMGICFCNFYLLLFPHLLDVKLLLITRIYNCNVYLDLIALTCRTAYIRVSIDV